MDANFLSPNIVPLREASFRYLLVCLVSYIYASAVQLLLGLMGASRMPRLSGIRLWAHRLIGAVPAHSTFKIEASKSNCLRALSVRSDFSYSSSHDRKMDHLILRSAARPVEHFFDYQPLTPSQIASGGRECYSKSLPWHCHIADPF